MKINLLWLICLFVRLSLSFIVLYISNLKKDIEILDNIIFLFLFLLGTGFIYKFIFGSNNEIQISKVFWHSSRISHGIIFIFASIMYITKNKKISSILILIDILYSFLYRIIMNV